MIQGRECLTEADGGGFNSGSVDNRVSVFPHLMHRIAFLVRQIRSAPNSDFIDEVECFAGNAFVSLFQICSQHPFKLAKKGCQISLLHIAKRGAHMTVRYPF